MSNANLSATKQALLNIQKLQARLDRLERERTEPIAIVGIGCRFPGGADGPDAYWDVLRNGVDAIGEVPAARWSAEEYHHADPDAPGKTYTTRGGFLPVVDEFDPQFFGIAPREAIQLDPQQRLLLEVAWESLEHANIAHNVLRHSATGVFVGIISMEYGSHALWSGDTRRIDAYSGTGSSLSVAAGRLSYVLGLNGPCMALDTACSSSLLAVHLACQSLRLGECSTALAGGVNLMLGPELHVNFSKARMLSPDGRCKTFDEAADGYGRGEGCGVVVLKRLSDAVEAGDRIIAQIKGSAVNHDGASGGLTVPNGPAQERLIREALESAGAEPAQIGYIEAHGTGTALGDPIEMGALAKVFASECTSDAPLIVGSAKTNFGHLEAAAGIAGLIKLALAMQHGAIPPHLHFEHPSPHIDWASFPVEVPTRLRPWPAGEKTRLGGVSSFGFSGTNIHIVLQEAPDQAGEVPVAPTRSRHLLTLSARTPAALDALAASHAHYLAANPEIDPAHLCAVANTCRTHFAQRLAISATSAEELRALLEAPATQNSTDLARGRTAGDQAPPVVFLFTGQGAQYAGMGRQLYETEAGFRRVIDTCAEALGGQLEEPLLDVLYPQGGNAPLLDETAYTQPALFALECAIASLWQSWGVEPALAMGHSVGEFAAACTAGVFSLEDGLKLVVARGRLMQALPRNGAMVSARVAADTLTEIIAENAAGQVDIAAVNGPQSAVFSGERTAVEAVAQVLRARDIETKNLAVSHAFHSPLVEPILAEFAEVARSITYAAPRMQIISNVTGKAAGEALCDPEYWCRHVRAPVRFADGMAELRARGCELFVEIGPRPTLLGMGRQCFPEDEGVWLPSLRPQREDWQQITHSLGALWTRGVEVDWRVFNGIPQRDLSLPTYPFQRQRYWLDRPEPRAATPNQLHPLLGQRLQSAALAADERVFVAQMHPRDLELLAHHRIFDHIVLPAAGHVEMALAAAAETFASRDVAVEDLVIHQALVLPDDETRTVQLLLHRRDDGAQSFQIFSLDAAIDEQEQWTLHTSGLLRALEPKSDRVDLKALRRACPEVFPVDTYYRRTRAVGIEHGDSYQALQGLWHSPTQILGELELPAELLDAESAFYLHPVLLDAAFQMLGVPLLHQDKSDPYLPVSLEYLRLLRPPSSALVCVLDVHEQEDEAILAADLRLVEPAGELVAEARGLRFQQVERAALRTALSTSLDDWLYEVDWEPVPRFGEAGSALPTPADLADALAQDIEDALPRLAFYPDLLPDLESISAGFALAAFAKMGKVWRVGERFSNDELAGELGVVEAHRPLFARLLDILGEEGVLVAVDGGWQVVGEPAESAPEKEAERVLAERGTGALELDLLRRCGTQLAPVLRGQVEPLQVLFPDGDLGPLTRFYTESPGQQVINELLQKALSAALAEIPAGRGVRVLEIGAGTGGTTAFLLPHLDPNRTEYVFTDVSRLFTNKAGERFAEHAFVRCEVLDIERDPLEQGFPAHGFDIVIAANVLHATRTMRETLRHVRSLLAPGGALLLAEGTLRQRWIDLIFGLTEGWWRFADRDLRPHHALLASAAWESLLKENGFAEVVALPSDTAREQLKFPLVLLAAQADGTVQATDAEKRWLVLGDARGAGIALAAELRNGGDHCILAQAGGRFCSDGEGGFHINPQEPQDFEQLLHAIDVNGAGLDGVVYCWGLDAAREVLDGAAAQQLGVEACGGLLYLLQALGNHLESDPPTLWLATHRSAPGTVRANAPDNLAQAPLWGMGKIVALEHPEMRSVQLDLDGEDPTEQARQSAAELRAVPSDEKQLVLRGDQRYAPRLVRHIPSNGEELALSADATYLITGGTGALGLRIAAWMVEERGATHLALAGRTPPDAAARAHIAELEARGATVALLEVDVAVETDVAAMVKRLESEQPPVRGIIHAAGLLDDGVLAGQTPERFADVMAPKVQGALNLHLHTLDWPLDFFALFSSATALLGSPGQANYAAANAFLDALAAYRRARDLPALSINWGAWSQIGEAAQREADAYLNRIGVGSIAPAQGLRLLGLLLAQPGPQIGAIPIDWSVFSAQWGSNPFFARLRAQPEQTAATATGLADELAEIPPSERHGHVQSLVQSQVAVVLGLTPQEVDVQSGFFDLGMDSLTAIELKNQLQNALGTSLPATLLFKYPSVEKLVQYLLEDVLKLKEKAIPTPDTAREITPADPVDADELEKLIDAEFDALIGGETNGGKNWQKGTSNSYF